MSPAVHRNAPMTIDRTHRHRERGLLPIEGVRRGDVDLSAPEMTPYTPRHNGKVERYKRILAEEFLHARTWISERQRADGVVLWNLPLQLPPTSRRTRRTAARIEQRHGLMQLALK